MIDFAKARGFFNRVVLAERLTWFYDQFHPKLSLGDRGEIQAERFLLRSGWIIIARSYSTDLGEIDLIAVNGESLVFVEVKTRSSLERGLPEDAIDSDKIRRISQMAQQYLHHQTSIRFDVISILWAEDESPQLKHYKNAFQAPSSIGC